MAVLKFVLTLAFIVLAKAYPYDVEGWAPEVYAADLTERGLAQITGPTEDELFDSDNQGLGSVTAVDVDSNDDLFVFHRADKPWSSETFEEGTDKLTEKGREPISQDTIFKLNPISGRLISSFGANFFNVPHGLKIDGHDNIWVTDVGRHQVFRFPKNATKPDLELGEKFVPGSDDSHFCKPTDVAVASNGEFFVSDGYCNSRVLKFSKDGKVIAQWGTKPVNGILTPFNLNTPHSITLVEELNLVCVADREDNRALCYNAGLDGNKKVGTFNRTLVPQGDMGKVYAIYYNKPNQEVIVSGLVDMTPYENDGQEFFPARAFTYALDGQQIDAWAYISPEVASYGPSLIHSLCAAKDGQEYFLGDLTQQKVFKYTKYTGNAG